MSRENVEVVRRAYEAWNRDDFDAALLLIHPDVEWRGPGDLFLGVEEVYYGHAGVREWWNAIKEPWEYFESHIERTLEDGDKVVAVVRFDAVGRESGVKVELPLFVNVWELDAGLIIRFTAYYSLEEAIEAVGLTE
jgi:ketosteroid isomerase-like protein